MHKWLTVFDAISPAMIPIDSLINNEATSLGFLLAWISCILSSHLLSRQSNLNVFSVLRNPIKLISNIFSKICCISQGRSISMLAVKANLKTLHSILY